MLVDAWVNLRLSLNVVFVVGDCQDVLYLCVEFNLNGLASHFAN